MVTVEAAIAIGGLVLVLAVVLAGIGAVVARIRSVDAAGEGARRASRDDLAGVQALARDLPAGTEVVVTPEDDLVRVLVRVPPLGGALPGLRIQAEAVAAREPVVAAPVGVGTSTPDGATGQAGGPAGAPGGAAPGPPDGVTAGPPDGATSGPPVGTPERLPP